MWKYYLERVKGGKMKMKMEISEKCKECKSECVGNVPCNNCSEKERVIKIGDLCTMVLVVVVAYFWALVGL